MRTVRFVLGAAIAALTYLIVAPAIAADVKESNYRGWKTYQLSNGLIEVQVAPDIGGRIIQLKLGDFEYLWVNDQLAGKIPPPTGLGSNGEWLNWGGDKIWPAPQGWGSDDKWPGPPGPTIEGLPHKAEARQTMGGVEVQLTSPEDKSTGIQFSRRILVPDGSAQVHFTSTMRNIDKKPRRWGIWQVTQLSCADRQGPGYDRNVWAYCPLNPRSIFPQGYRVMFGAPDNPAWKPDQENKMMRVHYERQVGKIGLDSMAGWLAVVLGRDGRVFVERFRCFPEKKYPDDASVEFWLQAPGKFFAAGKENVISDDPGEAPPYMEAEVLSPFAELQPGERYTFENDWYVTNIGGNYPILDCTDVGVTCERFTAKMTERGEIEATGRFGVFYRGSDFIQFFDAGGKRIAYYTVENFKEDLAPGNPRVLSSETSLIPGPVSIRTQSDAVTVSIGIVDQQGHFLGELARAPIQRR